MGRSPEKVTIKYDPRDLSRVFVKLTEGYVEARPADLTRPAIALWEHRAALAALREAGRRAVDEDLIFSTILAQRALVEAAEHATKAARRQLARRAHLAPSPMIDVTPAGATTPAPIRHWRCPISRWRSGMIDEFEHLFPASRPVAALERRGAHPPHPRRSLDPLSARPARRWPSSRI